MKTITVEFDLEMLAASYHQRNNGGGYVVAVSTEKERREGIFKNLEMRPTVDGQIYFRLTTSQRVLAETTLPIAALFTWAGKLEAIAKQIEPVSHAADPAAVSALRDVIGLIQLLAARPDDAGRVVREAQNNSRYKDAITYLGESE